MPWWGRTLGRGGQGRGHALGLRGKRTFPEAPAPTSKPCRNVPVRSLFRPAQHLAPHVAVRSLLARCSLAARSLFACCSLAVRLLFARCSLAVRSSPAAAPLPMSVFACGSLAVRSLGRLCDDARGAPGPLQGLRRHQPDHHPVRQVHGPTKRVRFCAFALLRASRPSCMTCSRPNSNARVSLHYAPPQVRVHRVCERRLGDGRDKLGRQQPAQPPDQGPAANLAHFSLFVKPADVCVMSRWRGHR